MKKVSAIMLIFVIAIIASIGTYLVIENSQIIGKSSYLMDVTVWDAGRVGVDVGTDAIHFGGMGPGNGARRDVTIVAEEDLIISIVKKGEIANWVSNPNNFFMNKGEARNITFSINVPPNTPVGNYTGEAIFLFKKP